MLARIQREKKGTWHIKSILPHIIHSDKELDERTPTIPPKRETARGLYSPTDRLSPAVRFWAQTAVPGPQAVNGEDSQSFSV